MGKVLIFFIIIYPVNILAQNGAVSDSNYTIMYIYSDSINCHHTFQYLLGKNNPEQFIKIRDRKSFLLSNDVEELDTSNVYAIGTRYMHKRYRVDRYYNGEPGYSYCEQKIHLAEYTQRKKNQTITTTWYTPNQQRSLYKEHRKKKQSKSKKWAKNGRLITCLSWKGDKRHGWMKVWNEEGKLLYKIKFDEGYILKYYRYVDGKKEPGINYYLKIEKETISSLVPKEDITLFYPIRSQCRDICYPPSKIKVIELKRK